MKKLIATLAFASLPFFGFAQDMPRHKKPKETKDANVLDVTKNQGTSISYETPAELKVKLDKEADLQMWTPEQKAEAAAKKLLGGYLILGIARITIGSADTKWFTVVIQDEAGKEIHRETLDSDVASPNHGGGVTVWKNLAIVAPPTELKTGYKVFVIDAITKKRHEYLINN